MMPVNKPVANLIRAIGNSIAPRASGRGRLVIVNYHRILDAPDSLLESEPNVATFRWQMELLAKCFNVMPLHEALALLHSGRMPARAVCITFDDGYRSTHDLALPVLREFGLPATVFVTTGYLGEGSMWNDRILEAVRRVSGDAIDLRDKGWGLHPVRTLAERKDTIERLTEMAKYLPPSERQALTLKLEALAGCDDGPALMLTTDMVRTMSREGITIGAHTVSHPILTSLEDERARFEIEESKRQLEAITGEPVRFFAYPNGKAGMDFDERHVAMAREAGFDAAFTTAVGAATSGDDQFRIPRSRPWDTTSFFYILRLLRWLAY